jgi:hypothetical protein
MGLGDIKERIWAVAVYAFFVTQVTTNVLM